MKVFVAIYEHRHGNDVRVFQTFAGAQAWKDELGAEFWADTFDLKEYPQPDGPCGDDYFAMVQGDYFNVEECEVEP